MSSSQLPQWPPHLSAEEQGHLTAELRDWAFANSLVYRPVNPSNTSVIHAPFSLLPSPFPKHLFEQAVNVQKAYNALYAKISGDHDFLQRVIGGNVAKVDEFQRELWKIYERVRAEGVAQPYTLGLFRSDYLLHHESGKDLSLQQVEFNTISSSFGALSTKVSNMHRHFDSVGLMPFQHLKNYTLPDNNALKGLAKGLADAHKAYNNPKAKVLMVVQAGERNVFDQRALEYELATVHNVQVIRRTFHEISEALSLDSRKTLRVGDPSVEISVVYFRAGYGPADYNSQRDWSTRYQLERSRAIKCPSVALQLAGAKKVQQVLTEPGVLEQFIESKYDCEALRNTFTGLYPMDDSTLGKEALAKVLENPENFVLKPQREGGGNNIYRSSIPLFLQQLESSDTPESKEAYILMDIIQPPPMSNILVRANDDTPTISEVVSELGIYGVALFKSGEACEKNATVGHLLRTKGKESDEGGVAVGFSVIDSPLLV